jgi:alkaline phosphatase
MNLRLKVLCLLIVGVFAGLAVAYYKFYVVRKSHGIILFIVPGLNLELLNQSGIDPETGAGTQPRLTRASQVALVSNQTESGRANPAALLSYLSTGTLGLPDQIGLSPAGARLDNLIYKAQRAGRTAGVVSNSRLDNPLIGAFFSHQTSIENRQSIAQQLIDSTGITVILGEQSPTFNDAGNREVRNLIREAELKGMRIITIEEELNDLPLWRTSRTGLLGTFARPQPPPPVTSIKQVKSSKTAKTAALSPPVETPPEIVPPFPSLKTMVRQAIRILQYNWGGYLLIVHADLRDPTDPSVRAKDVIEHIRALNHAVQEARNWSGKNSTVILYVPYDLPSPEEKNISPIPPSAPGKPSRTQAKNTPPPPPPAPYPTVPAGFGWVAFYGRPINVPNGFLTAGELHEIISSNF